MKEIEIWEIVKKFNLEDNFNSYDIYVYILKHLKKLEKLINREVTTI